MFSLQQSVLAMVHTKKSTRCKNDIPRAMETEGESQHLSDSARRMHTVGVGAPCLRGMDNKKRSPLAWTDSVLWY